MILRERMKMHQFPLAVLTLFGVTACSVVDDVPPRLPGTPPPLPAISSQASIAKSEPETVAENLRIPWTIAFLPGGDMLVTERPGTLLRIGIDRKQYPIEGVKHVGEGGLLGLALHPEFEENHWIYLYFTTGLEGGTTNRIERYRFENDSLTEKTTIFSKIPGAVFHDGGCLAFGPDGYLYVTTGDAGNEHAAQDPQSLAGKILRIRDDGSIPDDNPFGNAVYSYGHRNPQGLAWDDLGRLWATEHGRSGALSGYDELNLIEKGKNYGWPEIQGSETQNNMETPDLHSGASTTWAPASAAYYQGSIFFGGLRGETLYQAVLPSTGGSPELKQHFPGAYGRIRAVVVGPDDMLYISTSNRDGRGSSASNDDRIIRIDPRSL